MRYWFPLRILLCLLLLANPLLGIAGGNHHPADAHEPGAAIAATPCHGAATPELTVADPPAWGCPHCAGDGPAVACQCCELGATSMTPRVLATPARLEGGPVNVLGRLPGVLPLSPSERRYRPPIDAV